MSANEPFDHIETLIPHPDAGFDPLFDALWQRLLLARQTCEDVANDYWWEHHHWRAAAKNRDERPKFGCKVRYGRWTINPHWFYYQRSRDGRNAFPKYIRPTHYKPTRYAMSVFHAAPPWEQELIAEVEGRFILLRGYVDALYSAFRTLRGNEVKAMRVAGLDHETVAAMQRHRGERMVLVKAAAEFAATEAARRGLD